LSRGRSSCGRTHPHTNRERYSLTRLHRDRVIPRKIWNVRSPKRPTLSSEK
jgi:hypothetical protein